MPAAQEALRFAETSFGPDHPAVANSLFALGSVYHAQGRLEDAESLYKRSLSIAEKALGPDSPDVGQTLSFLAKLRVEQKRYAEAEPLYRRAVAIAEKAMKPDDLILASLFSSYAGVLRKTGKAAEAEQMEARGSAIRAREGRGSASGTEPASRSGDISFDCVLGFLQTSLPRTSGTSEVSLRVDTLIKLAEVYALAGNRDKAVESLTRARRESEAEAKRPTTPATDARSKALAPFLRPDPDVRPAAFARRYLAIGAYDEALDFARKITRPQFRATQLSEIAMALAASGDKQKATDVLAEAVAAIDDPGKDSRGFGDVATGYARLGACEEARRIALSIPDRSPYAKAPALVSVASECAKGGARGAALQTVSDSLRVADMMTSGSAARYETLARAASVQIDLGEKEGLRLLTQVLADVPKTQLNGKVGPVIADAYANARQYDKAKEVANSIESPPFRADALLEIARRYVAAGDRASAGELLDQSFRITLDNRSSDPTVRFPRFGEIAVEYARASRTDRAGDVLVAALREIRGQFFFEATYALFDVFRAYAKAGVTPDATARGLIADLCSGKAFEPTPSELAKERRAQAAADAFIERWHQTLDLSTLFDEFFVSSPKQRQRNLRMFYAFYLFLAGAPSGIPVDPDVDEPVMREFYFTASNLFYLVAEYQLAYRGPNGSPPKMPAMGWPAKLDPKRISRQQMVESVDSIRAALPGYRKSLTPRIFRTETYVKNLKEEEEKQGMFRVVPGAPEFGVPENDEVYNVHRGVFEFYFIEEQGKLKVLTLGFEL